MASIDDFKANLIGGGARANQFRVTITPPPGIAIGLDVRRTSFLATATNLPGMTVPADYQSDLFVEQLDRDDTVLKTYIFKSAYPLTTSIIDLASATVNELETFEVTWRYQHFEASAVNF